jgi:murein DD-endopeptidase MepM/ murein hydrolase activator NlpD
VKTAGVEKQLAALLDRQDTIHRQHSALQGLLQKARDTGLELAAAPSPSQPSEQEAAAHVTESGPRALAYAPAPTQAGDIVTGTLIRSSATGRASDPQELLPLLFEVHSELDRAADRQSLALDALTAEAQREANKLSAALAPIGITAGETQPAEAAPRGGPFIPARGLHFVERAAILSRTLDEIAALRRSAEAMPLAMPVRSERISSGYGYRQDPFLNRPALHAGLDFPAPAGAEVLATAAGAVTAARWNGGYGYMVEIRHARGLSTRYGHLSAILVEEGAEVVAGMPIGRVGSTGPHLHYETRRGGRAVNPAPYLAAGRAL